MAIIITGSRELSSYLYICKYFLFLRYFIFYLLILVHLKFSRWLIPGTQCLTEKKKSITYCHNSLVNDSLKQDIDTD